MASLRGKDRVVVAAVVALVLAGCGYGVTGNASNVDDVSATVSGVADRTEPGGINWWFEFGTTTAYGSTTGRESAHVTGPLSVSARIVHLTPSTTYHYRLCVTDFEDAQGSCGADRTFTTGTARDHVEGSLWVGQTEWEPPFLGLDVYVTSEPDGSNPTGSGRGWVGDDEEVFAGPVVCVRIVEDRAAVGIESTTGEHTVVYIWDNGHLVNDWFEAVAWSNPSTSCPPPPVAPGPDAYTDDVGGDVTIIDAD